MVRAGRRGGKTLLEEVEAFDAGQLRGQPAGWFAPTYKILLDAWEDLQRRFAPFIADKRESEHRLWWRSGAPLEFWSLDSGVIARSRKYGLAVIDEAGLVPDLAQRWRADIEPTLLDLDGRAIFASTPNLVGPDFNVLYQRGRPHGDEWASFSWSSQDNPYLPANVAERIARLRTEGVPDWIIRQEYFAEPAESDRAFFRAADIAAHQAAHGREPIERATLDVPADRYGDRFALIARRERDALRWTPDPVGPWRLWEPRDPSDNHCIGVDLAYGVGSSNTVFSVGRMTGRRKTAEYAWPGVTPDEAAMLAAAAGAWWSGPNGPATICFERTGPGEVFAKRMQELRYPSLWYERKDASRIDHAALTRRYGWDSTAKSKEAMLGAYRAALSDGKFVNPSIAALAEALTYQYDGQMRLTSPFERSGRDDPARVKHGDRAIADGLLNLAFDWTPEPPVAVETEWAPNTYGAAFNHPHPNADVGKPVRWGR